MNMPRVNKMNKIQSKIESKSANSEIKPAFIDGHSISLSVFSAAEFARPVYSYNTLIDGVAYLIMNVLIPYPYLKNPGFQLGHAWLAIPKGDLLLETALKLAYQDNPFNGWIVTGRIAKGLVPSTEDWSSQEDAKVSAQELQRQGRIALSDVILVEAGGLIPWVGIRTGSSWDFNDLETINGNAIHLPYAYSINKFKGFICINQTYPFVTKNQKNAEGKELTLNAKLYRDARDEVGSQIVAEIRDSSLAKSRANNLATELEHSRSLYLDGSLRIDYRNRTNAMLVTFIISIRNYKTVNIIAPDTKIKKDLIKKNGINEALSLLSVTSAKLSLSDEIARLESHLVGAPWDVTIEQHTEESTPCYLAES